MATWEDVRQVAATLPETLERSSADGRPEWRVRNRSLAWERPLRRADYEALGEGAPDGPILCVQVADVEIAEALVADDPAVFFRTPHFAGYPAVLVQLAAIDPAELRGLLVDAWLAQAPKRTARAYREANPEASS